jgi:hypothetical protein
MSRVNRPGAEHAALICQGGILTDQADGPVKIASLAGAENLVQWCHEGVIPKNTSIFIASLTICVIQLS